MSTRDSQKRHQKKDSPISQLIVSTDKQLSETTTSLDKIKQIFFGKGTEELTDDVIEELVLKGWERKRLIKYQKEGFRYNRSRDTLFDPDTHFM